LFNVLQLQMHEIQDVLARCSTRPFELYDPLDLIQAEAEPAGLSDEPEERQRLRSI